MAGRAPVRLATVVNSILQARGRASTGIGLCLTLTAIGALAQVSSAHSATVRPIDPPSGAALVERPVTLRWGLDVSDCAPNKTALTQVQVEIDGQLGPAYLPEPADTGLNAGLFAAAAGDGFRFTVSAMNLKTDGTASV